MVREGGDLNYCGTGMVSRVTEEHSVERAVLAGRSPSKQCPYSGGVNLVPRSNTSRRSREKINHIITDLCMHTRVDVLFGKAIDQSSYNLPDSSESCGQQQQKQLELRVAAVQLQSY